MDSPPDSSVYGIYPARIPEWVAISFSRGDLWLESVASALAGGFYQLSHHRHPFFYT